MKWTTAALTFILVLSACLAQRPLAFAEAQSGSGSAPAEREPGATFFVSTGGQDTWTGRLAAPNADRTDGPFATLARARDAVRVQKGRGAPGEPIIVSVRGGKYYLDQTLTLGKEDSGAQDAPVTYAAYPGERPILSGGRKIAGWKPYKDRILQAPLPSLETKWTARQLFLNGKRQPRARWPKLEPADPLYSGWALIEGPAHKDSTDAFIYRPGTFAHRYAKPTEIEVIYWANVGGWRSMVPIKTLDEEKRTITLVHSGWQFNVPGWFQSITFTPNNRFFVENALEDLTQAGEWCFDSTQDSLYYWPPTDSLQGQDVVIPVLDVLVDLRGASWITISGLTFTETIDGDNFHRQGVEGAGAMFPRPGWRYCGDAVHLMDAEHCRIEDNLFDAVGGNAVYLEGYNARNVIAGNEIDAAGANGVCLIGTKERHPLFNSVTDNHIHDSGVINKYTAGIFCGMSDGNTVSHNRIERLPHHAINLGNSPFGRNIIEYNDIGWVDREVADSAAINCWMEEPPDKNVQRCGHVIRFNRIGDVYGCEVVDGKVTRSRYFPTSGIYLDNYTSNCFVFGNIIARCSHSGILAQGGKNNIIENNIFVDVPRCVTFQDVGSTMPFWKGMSGFMTGNHVVRNIFYWSRPDGNLFGLHAWTDRVVARSDDNLFFHVGHGPYRIDDWSGIPGREPIRSLAQWRRLGYDTHSVIADPLFVAPEQNDYRLSPESPAFHLGFVPVDTARIGPRTPSQRR